MLNLIILTLKILLVALWGLFLLDILSLSPLSEQYQFYVLVLAIVVLTAHFIEYFVMKAKIKVEMSFIQTMFWGFGYWLPLLNNK